MLVDQDECWFSRFAQPQLHAFTTAENNLRLIQREPDKGETDKALACYGAVCDQTKERFFSFADGQPNSEKSIAFLSTLLAVAQERCQRVLVVIWDRATWHKSKKVTRWVRQHNRQVKLKEQGVRLLTCLLPSKSPWLNPMEPIWLHTKRKVVEPDGDLSVNVLKERLCAQFDTNLEKATLKVSA
jgi:transposase